MSFDDAPSYIQKRGALRIDLNPDAIYFSPRHGIALDGKAEKYFLLLD
jgi:hypothetical protein